MSMRDTAVTPLGAATRADPGLEPESPGWLAACGAPVPHDADALRASYVVAPDRAGRSLRLLGAPGRARTARSEARACGVVFDGVLFNRAELRGQLADGEPAADDAALALHAYLRWGEEAPSKLQGVFALVVWDARRGVLFGARDRVGVYPLFHARAGREVLFSTSSEVLVRHRRVSADLNRPVLAEWLCNRSPGAEETCYASVRRVPPGHLVRFAAPDRRDAPEPRRYWDPTTARESAGRSQTDHLERFTEVLDRAVGRALALGPAGIFLSGGLDSVSVAATAAARARERGLPAPWALSLVFPEPCNEEVVQRGVAAGLRLPHFMMPFEYSSGESGPMAAALELCRTYPAPLLSLWQPAYLLLAAEGRRRGCRTILTGGGGDTWLTPSPFLAADLLRSLDVRGLLGLYRTLERSYPVPRGRLARNLVWKCGARPLLQGAAAAVLRAAAPAVLRARRRRFVARTTPAFVAPDDALRRELDARAAERLPEPRLERFARREARLALDQPVVSMMAEEVFESARRAGTHQFSIYQDPDVIETLLRMPPEVLNRGGRSKGLVREAMARRFPRLGFETQKKVMANRYYGALVRREAPHAWRALGGVPTLARLGVVEAGAAAAAVDEVFANAQARREFRVWSLLSLEAWARVRS